MRSAGQGQIGDLVSRIFDISCDYVGSFTVSLSQMSLSEIVDDVNEKHAHAWSEICEHAQINTPLSPLVAEVCVVTCVT